MLAPASIQRSASSMVWTSMAACLPWARAAAIRRWRCSSMTSFLARSAVQAQLLGEISWAKGEGIDARCTDDFVEMAERSGRLEHDRHVDLLVQVNDTPCRTEIAVEVGTGPQSGHAAHPQRSVARRLSHPACDFGRVNLGDVQSPHSNIKQASDPFTIPLGRANNEREVQGASEHGHVGNRFDRRR